MVYRPAIASSGVGDLGLADVLPNFFWAAFCVFVFANWMTIGRSALAAFGANAVYELDQMRHGGLEDRVLSSFGRTFDPWDIVAAAIGVMLAYTVLRRRLSRTLHETGDTES